MQGMTDLLEGRCGLLTQGTHGHALSGGMSKLKPTRASSGLYVYPSLATYLCFTMVKYVYFAFV